MSSVQAETLLYYLQNQNQVSFAKVYDRTGDAVICYEGERAAVIRMIQLFHMDERPGEGGLSAEDHIAVADDRAGLADVRHITDRTA